VVGVLPQREGAMPISSAGSQRTQRLTISEELLPIPRFDGRCGFLICNAGKCDR